MRLTWQDFWDFFFPQKSLCPLCREKIKEENYPICKECLKGIEFLPLLPGWQAASLGRYSGVLKEAIHRLKYRLEEDLAQPLGKMLAEYLRLDLGQTEGIVPIPLHQNRLRQRGFNQAQLLSQVMGEELGIPVLPQVLLRNQDTVSQVGLSKKERRKNMTGAFGVAGVEKIRSKNLVLIDDVYTTGITTLEAKKVLLEAGAKEVKILTLARGKL